jgi:hypothetical protein
MKKLLIAALLAGLFVGAGFAEGAAPAPSLDKQINTELQDMAGQQLGTLTVADLEKIAERISIAEQKVRYVRKAQWASFMFPGAGQFMTGDPAGGSLYLAGDFVLFAGTLVGAYFLLPSDLQFGASMNYFTDSYNHITTAWGSHSFVDYLPSLSLLAGGFILKHVLGWFSSEDAARRARENVDNGTVTFTPDFDFTEHGPWMGMRFRY